MDQCRVGTGLKHFQRHCLEQCERAGLRASQAAQMRATPENLTQLMGYRPDIPAGTDSDFKSSAIFNIRVKFKVMSEDRDGLQLDGFAFTSQFISRRAGDLFCRECGGVC